MTYVTIVNTQPKDELALFEVLSAIEQQGKVNPEALVDKARPADSPIHHLFEWDDVVAGERYRLEQARLYIARIEYVAGPEREPYLVELQASRPRPTRLDASCLTGIDMTMCSIERLQAELMDMQKRYGQCAHLQYLLQGVIEEAVRELSRLALDLPVVEDA